MATIKRNHSAKYNIEVFFSSKRGERDTRGVMGLLRLSRFMLFQVIPDLIEFKSIWGAMKKRFSPAQS